MGSFGKQSVGLTEKFSCLKYYVHTQAKQLHYLCLSTKIPDPLSLIYIKYPTYSQTIIENIYYDEHVGIIHSTKLNNVMMIKLSLWTPAIHHEKLLLNKGTQNTSTYFCKILSREMFFLRSDRECFCKIWKDLVKTKRIYRIVRNPKRLWAGRYW